MSRSARRLRRVLVTTSAAALAAGIAVPLITGSADAQAPATTITVSNDAGRSISSGLYGFNNRWAYDNFGAWDPARDGFYASNRNQFTNFQAQLDELGPTSIRYAGGTIANLFHWQRATGPASQRGKQIHGKLSYLPIDSDFGPDDYGKVLAGLRRRGLPETGDIVADFNTGPISDDEKDATVEAAGWVRHMRAKHYPVRYWEVGNEMTLTGDLPNGVGGDDQLYWRDGDPVAKDAHDNGFHDVTRDVVQLYADGGYTKFVKSDGQTLGKPDTYSSTAGVSNGKPHQHFVVWYAPVQNQTIYVDGTPWREARSLAGLGHTGTRSRAYTLDHHTGAVTFGDGKNNGAVPASGAKLTVSYVSGPHPGFSDFYRAMKKANPAAQICAGLGDEPSIKEFARIMGTRPYDCVQLHDYVHRDLPAGENTATDFLANTLQQEATQQQAVTDSQKDLSAHGSSAEIVLTEYGDIGADNPQGTTDFHRSMSEGLLMADDLGLWAKDGLPLADFANLNDFTARKPPKAAGGTGGSVVSAPDNVSIADYPNHQFVSQATALVLRQLRSMSGSHVLPAAISGNKIWQPASGAKIPVLNSFASRGNGKTYVTVVNRSPDTAVTARLATPGARRTGATASTVSASSILAINSLSRPHAVSLVRSRPTASQLDSYRFAPHSVTTFALPNG